MFNPLPHEHIVKNGRFIEMPPVTSSNCFETMKYASILMKRGTNVNWTIASVFPVTMATGDVSKLPKITFLHRFFSPSKLISKCCNFSMD
jgi:hypothetical protein